MKIDNIPQHLKPFIIPETQGDMVYRCLGCNVEYDIKELLYTCPACSQVLMIYDLAFNRLKEIPGDIWHQIFDYRKMLSTPALKGIYRYHEFIGPLVPLDSVVYLGEGHTPLIEANKNLQEKVGIKFYFKNDGQNPSASFKDRGMASAISYIHFLIQEGMISDVLTICASTGDTSAAAALYAAYLNPLIKSAVLLPNKKVTPQQLSQPLAHGASVFAIPGVFDDCMRIVETLSERYNVVLLNSKNAWRVLGQESYSYEISQDFEYELRNKVIVVPIGNAGNITAIMNGFLKFYETGIINTLPKILGIQSKHANPVVRYYHVTDPNKRKFVPISVRPSTAQAAMIGNPVSMPRVIHLVERYNATAGEQKVFFIDVTEQEIMDWNLTANNHGHIACTQGGESLAGLVYAINAGIVDKDETAIVDSTAHTIKFSGFQQMYFDNSFPSDYNITPNSEKINIPFILDSESEESLSTLDKPLTGEPLTKFVRNMALKIAKQLRLNKY